MKHVKNPTLHNLLVIGALVLAFSFRLIRLGAMPLFDSEAQIALEALSASRSIPHDVGPFPAIVGLTGLDFFVLSPGNFLARFWMAAFSSLIVIVPFLFRERLGWWGATISAFLFAISPELVGPSRLIGTPVMAAACLLLSLGFLFQRKPILAGFFTSLGLMSGPGFWFGAAILLVSSLVAEWLFDVFQILKPGNIEYKKRFWLRFGLSLSFGVLVVGTGFFMAPQSLSGVFSGLVQFVGGIFHQPILPIKLRFLALIAYAVVPFIFGLWGGIRGAILRNKLDLFLFVWAGFGLFFYLLYPGGQPSLLIWMTFPLWLLTARALAFVWRFPRGSRLVIIGMALLVVVVSAFMLLSVRTLVRPGLPQSQQLNTLLVLIGGLILLVAVVLLINFGWAGEIALAGLISGMVVVMLGGLVAVSVNTTSLNPDTSYELWLPEDQPITSEWLKISIDRVINWNKTGVDPVEIAVSDFEVPAMEWVLKDYDSVTFVPYLPPQSRPGILITNYQATPEISSAYRGQDLVWSRTILWEQMNTFQYFEWLITRNASTHENKIIFWVRTDLMPDEQFAP